MERAKRESPFGTTIAHGNLTLSIIDGLREEISARDASDLEGIALGVNMGWNRVRFPAPVPAGSRVRITGELVSVEEKGSGWWEVVDKLHGRDRRRCQTGVRGRERRAHAPAPA